MAGDSGHSDSRASMVDLTKLLGKARTILLPPPPPILSVSSSDHNNDIPSPHVLVSSDETVQPDDDSGNLKRKLEGRENIESTYIKIHQETDSPMKIKNPDEISSRTTDDIEDQVVSSSAPPRRYACNLCGKSFTSYQALGGHKSSHNRFKMTICNVIDLVRPKKQLPITNTCDQHIASSSSTGQSDITDDRTHTLRKNICFDKFPSASCQALGGHRTRHWNPNKTLKILDFDLNQLPKEEDEDDPSAN